MPGSIPFPENDEANRLLAAGRPSVGGMDGFAEAAALRGRKPAGKAAE